MPQLMECVPNISEGRNEKTIASIQRQLHKIKGVQLLHTDIGYDANRTVFTLIGEPLVLVDAAFILTTIASKEIDMQQHKGTHPRLGCVDVCPFIPLENCTMQDAVDTSKQLGQRIVNELNISVYLYEHAQLLQHRKRLEQIRAGEYEGLEKKMQLPEWRPDFGTTNMNKKSGAMVIGARDLLIAYNINLQTTNLELAQDIAVQLRSSGGKVKHKGIHLSTGILPFCKAIAWYANDGKNIQISTNLTNYAITSVFDAFTTTTKIAQEYNITITGSELIGMISFDAIKRSVEQIEMTHTQKSQTPNDVIAVFEKYFHLNDYYRIDLKNKILPFVL